jgi:hypothetical protein
MTKEKIAMIQTTAIDLMAGLAGELLVPGKDYSEFVVTVLF